MISQNICSMLGILSLLIWSSNVYLYKKMITDWGYFTGNSIMYIIAGFTGLIIHLIFIKQRTKLNYTTFPAFLFLNINNISLSLAYGFAKIGSELLQITIITYLWTITTYVLLIYFLKYDITKKIVFTFGMLFAFFGICVTCIGFEFSYLEDFFVNVKNDWYVYLFSLCVVLSWSLYSVYIKKYSSDIYDDHIYISFVTSGLAFLLLSFVMPLYNNWNEINTGYVSILVMIYESVVATLLPYLLWNIGYKYGDDLLISRASVMSPILNVSFISIFYKLKLYINIFVGATLLIISAYLCKISTTKPVENNQISDQNEAIDTEKN